MSPEQEENAKSKLIQQIVGAVSFAEIVKILHELATREVNHQFSEATDEQKQEIYEELFNVELSEVQT
jgi:hypothetical protein